MEIKLKEAEETADEIGKHLKKFFKRLEIAGSVRRRKEIVHDIDFVGMPFMLNSLMAAIRRLPCTEIKREGPKIVSFDYKGKQVDIYFATPDTWETTMLFRTGSANHNKMLCTLALAKGMKLKMGGLGLVKDDMVIANTEKGIIEELTGGKFIEPEARD